MQFVQPQLNIAKLCITLFFVPPGVSLLTEADIWTLNGWCEEGTKSLLACDQIPAIITVTGTRVVSTSFWAQRTVEWQCSCQVRTDTLKDHSSTCRWQMQAPRLAGPSLPSQRTSDLPKMDEPPSTQVYTERAASYLHKLSLGLHNSYRLTWTSWKLVHQEKVFSGVGMSTNNCLQLCALPQKRTSMSQMWTPTVCTECSSLSTPRKCNILQLVGLVRPCASGSMPIRGCVVLFFGFF